MLFDMFMDAKLGNYERRQAPVAIIAVLASSATQQLGRAQW
jgi:hypothetical protein